MKKLYILWILSILSVKQIFAQKEYNLTFKDGEKKTVVIDYDDPELLPKWGVDVKFFGLTFFNQESFSCRLTPYYRLSYKFTVDAHIALSYSAKMDGNTNYGMDVEDGAKACHDWSLMGHYILASKEKTKDKMVPVDYGSRGTTSIVYTAKLPRTYKHNFCADGGFVNYQYYSGGSLVNKDNKSEHSDTSYSINNVSNFGLNLGISYFKSESYKITSNDISRSYWRASRLYSYLTVGLANGYKVNRYISSNSGSGESTKSEVTNGYEQPLTSGIGYRIGFEKNWGAKNTGTSMSFGFEFGKIPGLKLESSATSIFLFHIGFGLAPKPSEL